MSLVPSIKYVHIDYVINRVTQSHPSIHLLQMEKTPPKNINLLNSYLLHCPEVSYYPRYNYTIHVGVSESFQLNCLSLVNNA